MKGKSHSFLSNWKPDFSSDIKMRYRNDFLRMKETNRPVAVDVISKTAAFLIFKFYPFIL